MNQITRPAKILDPGLCLTLRPMRYPQFFQMYEDGIRNSWSVNEINWAQDILDLQQKIPPAERHMIERLVAFFATGDEIVSNNLVLNLYKHINSPEARMYLSRQLFEESVHVQFYVLLLDNYIHDEQGRFEAFAAVENIPSIRRKSEFCMKWLNSLYDFQELNTVADRQHFLLNLICFAAAIEGLFFFGAFCYVYFLRSKGLLPGLAAGTNWVFRDESMHMRFAFEVVRTVMAEEPGLFTQDMAFAVYEMLDEAIECEAQFAEDMLSGGVVGMQAVEVKQYLRYIADQRLSMLNLPIRYGDKNPFPFMDAQDVQELANFFERRVSAYQTSVEGSIDLAASF